MYGTLGAQIRHYRRLRDMSQEELAQAAGYKTKASINKIEKNLTAVPHDMLIRIASALRVPVDNLVGSGNYTPHSKLDTTEQAIEYAYNKTDDTAQALRKHLMGALQALNMETSTDTTLVPKFNALSSSNQQVVMTLIDTLLTQQKNAPTGVGYTQKAVPPR